MAFLERVTHGQLVDAGALHVAGDAEESRSAVALGAELGVRLAAHQQNVRRAGDGFGVVDDGGAAVQADDGGEGRLDAGHAALAFEGLHQGGLFADFVGAGAGLGDDVEVDARAEDVLAEEAFFVGFGDGALDDLEQVAVLAAQVDEAQLRPDGEAGDHGALDDRVRVLEEDDVVLAGAGLGFVAVDEHVLGLFRLLGHEAPLHAGGEAGAAAAAQPGGFHDVDDPAGHGFGALGERHLHGLVAVELEVLVDAGSALAPAALEDDRFVGMGHHGGHYFTSFPRPSE